MVAIAVLALACHQNTSTSGNVVKSIPDLKSENLKGNIQQLETDTYLVDSVTGKMGKLDGKGIEIYNDSGYTVSYSNYSPKDNSTTVYKYDHNANGFTTDMTTTKNNKPLSSMKILVDSTGHYSLATSFDSTGKEDVYYDSIKSNDYGEVLSAKGHHPDSTLKMTFVNKFDSVYYVGGESKDSVGKLTYSSSVKLNDKRDPQQMDETTVTKDSTKNTTTTYTYDAWDNHGNWIQQTSSEKGKPKKIVKRIITYKP